MEGYNVIAYVISFFIILRLRMNLHSIRLIISVLLSHPL